jgi:hypothetical protein
LFLALNIDNKINNNNIINDSKDELEVHFLNIDCDENIKNKYFNKEKKYKYLCLNNMNQSFRDTFIDYMTYYL